MRDSQVVYNNAIAIQHPLKGTDLINISVNTHMFHLKLMDYSVNHTNQSIKLSVLIEDEILMAGEPAFGANQR